MPKKIGFARGYMAKWLFYATLIGIGGGISALLLNTAINWVSQWGNRVPLVIAPVIGGILVSLLFKIDPNVSGSGTPKYIDGINLFKGRITKRTWLTKLLASASTIGFNGSGGVEGPMLLMGGSLANWLASIPFINRRINKEDRRILTVCGAAGAIGAIFRSPLGGGIFAAELLYKSSLHYSDMFPAILSSTMGFVVYATFGKTDPLFTIPAYLPNPANVLYFILAGVLAGYAALLFMTIYHKVDKLGDRLSKKKFGGYLPVLGGILTGIVLIYFPEAGGTGSSFIQQIIESSFHTHFLILLLLAKILATAFTVGFRGSAGLVIPALFIGAVTGGIIGNFLAPTSVDLASSMVIAGMAASLSSIANVPIAAAVMLIEMVGFQVGGAAVVGSVMGFIVGQKKMIYVDMHHDDPDFRSGKEFRKIDRYFEK